MKRVSAYKLLTICTPAAAIFFTIAGGVRADEFTNLPGGDPIYSLLDRVQRGTVSPDDSNARPAGNLTRFEAALQTARSYFLLVDAEKNRKPQPLSREACRALRELAISLRPELIKLDVEPAAIVALTDRLGRSGLAGSAVAPAMGSGRPATPGRVSAPANSPSRVPTYSGATLPGGGFMLSRGQNTAAVDLAANPRNFRGGQATVSLSQQLRVQTALLAMARDTRDPFGDDSGTRAGGVASRLAGSATALTYDFNPSVRLRAIGTERELAGDATPAGSPLSAPLFAGAARARSAGGGLDVDLGNFWFSTDVERLMTEKGAAGTRLGGGVGLNAWQNRLTLSASMARLVPEDSAVVSSTATEMNIGVDVTRRLSLNLMYQGLFSEQSANNSSRVAGGVTLNF